MKIAIGSINKVKIDAVRETLAELKLFDGAMIVPADVSSGVRDQPLSIEEIIEGASNRAHNAFSRELPNLSIGIESGFMSIKDKWTRDHWVNLTACVIYDGKHRHIAHSSGFECPTKVMNYILKYGCDLNQAYYKAGLTTNPEIGKSEGVIGMLTNGSLPRKEYTKEAIRLALIPLIHPELY